MAMEELSLAQIIDGDEGEEQCDEEFYEKIEAPKFVDFTAPERRRPDEDCYWFCMRVGCDRKHEEEIDPEAIYNNFVLRVMAARSPNVRFRRAMDRKALSTNLKCPQTAPPKPTRTRALRLETISSISQKTVTGKPLTKLSATPRAKASRPDAGAKALTTPRNRKPVSNPRPFQSVRKPKALDSGLAKSKVVAKTLFFHSPKKAVKLKASLELNTPLRKICSGMKKLEITSQKKHVLGYNKTLPSDGCRKKLGVREVKSRVFDSLRCKGQEVKSARCLKKKEVCELEPKIDEKSRKRSLDVHVSAEVTPDSRCALTPLPNDSGDNDSTKIHAGNSKNESKCDEITKSGSEEQKIQECTILDDHNEENAAARGDRENASSSDVKESNDGVMESDDKENASAPDGNSREQDHPSQGKAAKSKILDKNKNSKCTQKAIQVLGKTIKDSNSAASGMQVMKYRKPKPTNPKPFRLRTDERRILKEANMEKKLHLPPLNEIATVTKVSRRKQLDAPREGTRKDHEQPREMVSHADSQLKHCLDDVTDKEVKGIAKRTKSPLMKQPARPQGLSSSGKKKSALKVAPRRLSSISAASQTMLKPHKASTKQLEKEAKLKLHSSPSTSRSVSRGRTRAHTPMEPKISTALKF